ncbi:hypothetical protein ACA910_008475 [Epithemia clementina (nom. ined.)]
MISNHHQVGGNHFSKFMSSMTRGKRKDVTVHADDLSLSQSSTHTVDEAFKVLVTPTPKSLSRVRRSVHFEEDHNV